MFQLNYKLLVAVWAVVTLSQSTMLQSILGCTQESKQEVVAELNGKPLFREELAKGEAKDASKEMQARIMNDVWERFRQDHAKELEVTEEEISRTASFFKAQHSKRLESEGPAIREKIVEITKRLATVPENSAERKTLESNLADLEFQLIGPQMNAEVIRFVLSHWKQQHLLYQKYKGGRLLWQQLGIEAFDATRVFLEAEEKAGHFKIHDPKMRDEFYFYWTKQKHGSFLFDDPERIRKEFLEPEWLGATVESKP